MFISLILFHYKKYRKFYFFINSCCRVSIFSPFWKSIPKKTFLFTLMSIDLADVRFSSVTFHSWNRQKAENSRLPVGPYAFFQFPRNIFFFIVLPLCFPLFSLFLFYFFFCSIQAFRFWTLSMSILYSNFVGSISVVTFIAN